VNTQQNVTERVLAHAALSALHSMTDAGLSLEEAEARVLVALDAAKRAGVLYAQTRYDAEQPKKSCDVCGEMKHGVTTGMQVGIETAACRDCAESARVAYLGGGR